MCGRYAQVSVVEALSKQYPITTIKALDLWRPTYNASPQQVLPVLYKSGADELVLAGMTWGLVPQWSPTAQNRANTINAQQETAATKPTFRHLIQTNRCLVPISAFYEWQVRGNVRQPYALIPPDQNALLAGLWDEWTNAAGEKSASFTILTTPAEGIMQRVHHRQPVWIRPQHQDQWLDAKEPWPMLASLLAPYRWEGWEARTVSARVNQVRNNDASLLDAVAPLPVQGSLF